MPGMSGPPVARLQRRCTIGDTIEWRTPWALRIADGLVPIIAVLVTAAGAGWSLVLGAEAVVAGVRDSSWVLATFGLVRAILGAALGAVCWFVVRKTRWGELWGTRWQLDAQRRTALKFARSLLGYSIQRELAASEASAVRVLTTHSRDGARSVSEIWLLLRSGESVFVAGGYQVDLMDAISKDFAASLGIPVDGP